MYDIYLLIFKDIFFIKLRCKNNYKIILLVLNKILFINKIIKKFYFLFFCSRKFLRIMFSIFRDYVLSLLLYIVGR